MAKKLPNQPKGPARLSSPKSVGSLGLLLRKKKYESTLFVNPGEAAI